MKIKYAVVAILIVVAGCSHKVSVDRTSDLQSDKQPLSSYSIQIFMPNVPIQKSYHEIAEVSVGDTGVSINCGYEAAIEKIREKAFEYKADAAKISVVKSPDLWSTCYRMEGKLIVFRADAARRTTAKVNGMAFLLSENDYFASSYHVVGDSKSIKLTSLGSKRSFGAEVVLTDKENDLVILKAKDQTSDFLNSAFALGESSSLKEGQRVYCFDSQKRKIEGLIKKLSALDGDKHAFEISFAIPQESSGTPIFDASGNVVGVGISPKDLKHYYWRKKSVPEDLNLAIKTDYLKELAGLLKAIRMPSSARAKSLGSSERMTLERLFGVEVK